MFRPLLALIIAGATVWARDLGLSMTGWKWLLSGIWYGLLSLAQFKEVGTV